MDNQRDVAYETYALDAEIVASDPISFTLKDGSEYKMTPRQYRKGTPGVIIDHEVDKEFLINGGMLKVARKEWV
ncbi:hypothetical protein EQG49_12230 [Periweissella cryptocerci]|uniref:Uncharacterized protein n=1 Tax=Periweissella cryptocerci TaxID=2506420 RepID=A0A4V1AIY9_9LACO|nr:hypothetical protein [Periweissella cryptocerci]QBO37165.1 hypothetical protein EQG49_12230 [Periweissella cryptocerci]